MSTVDWARIAHDLVEIWNNGRFELVDEIIAPDYVRHDPAFSIAQEGKEIAMRYTWRASHTVDFMGIPPTGKRVEMQGISILRAENRKVVERWGGYDSLSLPRKPGVEL